MVTAYLGPSGWEVGAPVTVSGHPRSGDILVVDGENNELPNARIGRVSVNILEIELGGKLLRLAPLNPSESVEPGKKPMVVWVVQP
jgi:hypothetical protein